jgi:hypothetical protein
MICSRNGHAAHSNKKYIRHTSIDAIREIQTNTTYDIFIIRLQIEPLKTPEKYESKPLSTGIQVRKLF